MQGQEEKIRVAIRVRPWANDSDTFGHDDAVTLTPDGNSVQIQGERGRHSAATFRCETYLSPTTSQEEVFEAINGGELVRAALDGFPVTVFAYGQTGAGKSFTIFGKEDSAAARSSSIASTDGVLPRAAMELMREVENRREEYEYTLRVTCVEIYNELVRDLFDPKKESLPVRHSKEHGFYLEQATVVECSTAKDIIRVVKLAATNRIKSSHLLNERSNRSHCLVTIYIDSSPRDASVGIKKYGKLTIVDLAGSERATDTGAIGQQLKETGHINKSLYCLSQVIQAMTSNAKSGNNKASKFVPYRDSKLTMLLIDSLGGRSKTLMLACVNGNPKFATESTRTLEFAMGVAKIKNRPTAVLNPHEKLICDLKEQIRLLKLENMMLRSRTPGYFMEHPEKMDGDEMYTQAEEVATSPLGKALLSARHKPDYLTAISQQLHHRTSNNEAEFAAHASRDESIRIGHTKQRLATLKTKTKSNRAGSFRSPTKQSKGKKRPVPLGPSTPNVSVALPPVNQSMPLFQKRQLPMNQVPDAIAPPPRPASPPPDYDDLFGVETVSLTPSAPMVRATSVRQLEPLHSMPVHDPPRPAPSIPATHTPHPHRAFEAPLSPGAQIQRLLQGMVDAGGFARPSPGNIKGPTTTSTPKEPQLRPTDSRQPRSTAAATSASKRPVVSPAFEDARARELFEQLCRL